MKQIIRKIMIIVCCVFMLAGLTGCGKDKKSILTGVKYIRVADSDGSWPSYMGADMIIDNSDERFETILNILNNSEFTVFNDVGSYIGGIRGLRFYGKDDRYFERVSLGPTLFMTEEDLAMDIWEGFDYWDVQFSSLSDGYKFANEEDRKVFKELIVALYKEARQHEETP